MGRTRRDHERKLPKLEKKILSLPSLGIGENYFPVLPKDILKSYNRKFFIKIAFGKGFYLSEFVQVMKIAN